LPPAATLRLDWRGPANAARVPGHRSAQPATRDLGCFGMQDIGLPPYNDLITVGVFDARRPRPPAAGRERARRPAGRRHLRPAGRRPAADGCPIVLTAAFYGTAQ
jgi:hypothetical protein